MEAGHGQGFSIFSAQNGAAEDTTDVNQVTFEPLPDILAKTVTATALRPRISSIEKEQQRITAKHISNHDLFCRFFLIQLFVWAFKVYYMYYVSCTYSILNICIFKLKYLEFVYQHEVLLHIIQYIENILMVQKKIIIYYQLYDINIHE